MPKDSGKTRNKASPRGFTRPKLRDAGGQRAPALLRAAPGVPTHPPNSPLPQTSIPLCNTEGRHRPLPRFDSQSPRLSLGLCAGLALAIASVSLPLNAQLATLDIKRLTLEELMEIDVYSAGRRLEPVHEVPSAIYVLTNEDIRRARVTSIPEALRLVPGVQVARVDANKWAVSIRGFNSRIANKLLVLIDGRSIYDPLFSGTLWESKDLMLEDVERIEVIRGPGGTLWGANAVNGVINIITKHARDTGGGLISAGAGTEERAFGAARYGWQPRDDQWVRVYAKSLARDTGFSPAGNAHDAIHMNRAGFRWDWDARGNDSLRVSGDVYSGEADQTNNNGTTQDVGHKGGNLLAHWRRQLSDTQNLSVQFYYDRIELDNLQFGEKRNTYDLEIQYGFTPTPRHHIVSGLGYRNTGDKIAGTAAGTLDPMRKTDRTESAFVQDTITLVPDHWRLTLGTKVESNDYSGVEWQPNARLAWTPDPQRIYWAAASGATRVPSRLEADLVIGGTRLGDDVRDETVRAYEFGHRRLVTSNLWYDIATFYNVYRHLLTTGPTTLSPLSNRADARTYGIEVASRWQATPSWRLDAAYTYLQMDVRLDAPNLTGAIGANKKENPHHQLTLRSAFDMTQNLEVDATLRFVDDLPAFDVPAYTTLDLGLGWFPRRDLELTLVGQNLLDGHHPEQRLVNPTTGVTTGTEVQRGVYAKVTWRF